VRSFLDGAPDVRQGQKTKNRAGGDDVSPQCVNSSLAFYELEVRYLWRGDCPYELEPVKIVADAVEKPLTAAE
jgi:hypothetical protein